MNEDAEKWIAEYFTGCVIKDEMLRDAMRWAYADAARICREAADSSKNGNQLDEWGTMARSLQEDIEERMK